MTEKAFTLASISDALANMSSVRPSESSFDDPKHDLSRGLYAIEISSNGRYFIYQRNAHSGSFRHC